MDVLGFFNDNDGAYVALHICYFSIATAVSRERKTILPTRTRTKRYSLQAAPRKKDRVYFTNSECEDYQIYVLLCYLSPRGEGPIDLQAHKGQWM